MRGYDEAAELNKWCIKYVDWTFVKLNIFLVVLTYFKFNSIENVFFFFFFSFFSLVKKIHICKVFWNIYQGVPWNKINHELNHIHIWLFLKIPTQFKIMIATPSILPEHAKNCTIFCPGKILIEFSLLHTT